MNILLVAATQRELSVVKKALTEATPARHFTYLETGVGMIATTFALTEELTKNNYDLAINVGIAGTFDSNIALGSVVEVVEDCFAEEMIEDGEENRTYEEIGLREVNQFPFKKGRLHTTFRSTEPLFQKVNAITVNTVHGKEESIDNLRARLNPKVESMEGAAFFYVCKLKNTPCMQIRGISNNVEKRNRAAWKIEDALNNLAKAMQTIIQHL